MPPSCEPAAEEPASLGGAAASTAAASWVFVAGERARPEHYTEELTRAVHLSLAREAPARLEGRGGVIVDGTCHTRRERAALFGVLHRDDVTFLAVQCQVTLQTALARATSRMQSSNRVSDATPQVVAAQFHRLQTLDELPRECVLALDCE